MPSTAFDYEDMLDIIEDENCALFIGPGMLKDDNGALLEKAMWESLEADKEEHDFIRTYYKDDGLILLNEENMRRRLVRRIRRFYEEDHSDTTEVLRKITRLPVPLIFNLAPHDLLAKAFEDENQPHHYDFYYKGHPHGTFVTPSPSKPLIYNLLGDLSEPESLILTHKDLFDYLESIFAGNSMSKELRKLIQDTNTFIFLGLPFEKWYMQLLLRVLYHISSRLEKIEQFASIPETEDVNQLFVDEFKIKFMPDDGMTFIDGVFKICEEKGLLKSTQEVSENVSDITTLDDAKALIRSNKIDKGLKSIESVLDANRPKTDEKINVLTLIFMEYNDLNQKMMEDIATPEEKTSFKRLISRILSLIDDVKKLIE